MSHRYLLTFLVLFQSLFIYLIFLGYHVRYFGGLHYAFVLLFAMQVGHKGERWVGSKWFLILICCLFLLPWLMAQVYYAKQFAGVSLGIQEPSEFYEKKVALYSDYEKLDQILPRKAALLATNYGANSVYSPRKVYFSTRDVPERTELFLLWEGLENPSIPGGYRIGKLVYENAHAHIRTYRTPGRDDVVGKISVFELSRTIG